MNASRLLIACAIAGAVLPAALDAGALGTQAAAARSGTAASIAATTAASTAATTAASTAATTAASTAATTAVSATVRVEGIARTLLASTTVATHAQPLDLDGKPADTCTGDTAAVALQDATHGDWTGPYSHGLGYEVVTIRGESHPFTSPYYWALWVDGKPASTGICGAKLHPGASVLFFPQCSASAASKCPQGAYNPSVLDMSAPATVKSGATVTVTVRALANASGKPAAAAGAVVSAAGRRFVADAQGRVSVTLARAGTFTIVATSSDAIRDELTVKAG